ncbi:MAG: sialate O-acetylesterase [Paludibacter sp.]
MVFQQKTKLPVWGFGRNGELVTVEFNDQKASSIVRDRCWEVALKPMKAGGPYTMKILGDTTIIVRDVYVGEVWVCSGQSNMGRRMAPHAKLQPIVNYEKEKEAANYPLIRQYEVSYGLSDTLTEDTHGTWKACSPSTVYNFSAVGYFFARDLQKVLNVPIGLLFSSVGGTEAQFWISRRGLINNSQLRSMVEAYDLELKNYPVKLAEYNAKIDSIVARYKADSVNAILEHKPKPRKPLPPQNPAERRRVSCYYNAMIYPLVKYQIKGVLWYQGESDRDFALQYGVLFPTLIADWRKNWRCDHFPFLYVQIAPFKKNTPELREAQLLTLNKTVNTAMVVTTDCGDENDIHPPHKQPVGYRLSLAARALAYHEKIEYSGPVYKSFKIKGNKVELCFSHAANGLMCNTNDTLKGFTISGADKKYVLANTSIKGNKIIVFNDSIKDPIAVRYGWDNVPTGNLYNTEKLPASPFRTDFK